RRTGREPDDEPSREAEDVVAADAEARDLRVPLGRRSDPAARHVQGHLDRLGSVAPEKGEARALGLRILAAARGASDGADGPGRERGERELPGGTARLRAQRPDRVAEPSPLALELALDLVRRPSGHSRAASRSSAAPPGSLPRAPGAS